MSSTINRLRDHVREIDNASVPYTRGEIVTPKFKMQSPNGEEFYPGTAMIVSHCEGNLVHVHYVNGNDLLRNAQFTQVQVHLMPTRTVASTVVTILHEDDEVTHNSIVQRLNGFKDQTQIIGFTVEPTTTAEVPL